MRHLISEVQRYIGQNVSICGWVHRIRNLGRIAFVILRDRSGLIQLVFDNKVDFTVESVVSVDGIVQENEKAPTGIELLVKSVEVMSSAMQDIPIQINQEPEKLGLDTILDNRILSLRIPKIRSIFRVQSTVLNLFAQHMRSEKFEEIKTSKLIGTGTEGGTGLFSVKYFDDTVYLAQSPQFYKQAMVASGMERVFEIGTAYRAEKHDTPRHLNEYVSLDVEMAFIDSEHDLMDLEQRILKTIFQGIQVEHETELAQWNAAVPEPQLVDSIPRITHEEARKIISQKTSRRTFEINPDGERILCDWALKEAGIDSVFVYAFPRRKRPFYTFPSGEKETMSFDLLYRGLEITTGGRRIHDYTMLLESIERFKLEKDALRDYLTIFRFGCPPHGGFAIGLERLTQKILGLANVKEASLFPRDRKRTTP